MGNNIRDEDLCGPIYTAFRRPALRYDAARRPSYVFVAPPLCLTKEQVDEGLAISSEALKIAHE